MSTTTRITYEQYHNMIRSGVFDDDDRRMELIEGEIVVMSPIHEPHAEAVDELNVWSFEVLPPVGVRVRVQGPFGIPDLDSVPQPDLIWFRPFPERGKRRPYPADILLVVEVSDSSLAYDRGRKAKLYARSGIADYWIVNIPGRCLEVRRDPEGDRYRTVLTLGPGEEARPLAFPEITLPVARLFPD